MTESRSFPILGPTGAIAGAAAAGGTAGGGLLPATGLPGATTVFLAGLILVAAGALLVRISWRPRLPVGGE